MPYQTPACATRPPLQALKPTQHATRVMAIAVGLALSALTAQAQPLNSRWHGTWVSDDNRVTITASGIASDGVTCRWLDTGRPKNPPKTCVAFYDAGVPKSQLVRQLNDAERAIQRLTADRQNPLAAEDRRTMEADLARSRSVLANISDEVYRSVVMERAEGTGDCSSFFILDRDAIYEAVTCTYPEANTVRQYRQAK